MRLGRAVGLGNIPQLLKELPIFDVQVRELFLVCGCQKQAALRLLLDTDEFRDVVFLEDCETMVEKLQRVPQGLQ